MTSELEEEVAGLTGRVIRRQSGFYTVQTDAGTVVAVLRGRLKKERQEAGLAALGDFVRLAPDDGSRAGERAGVGAVIVEVLPRHSALVRRAPGPKGAWAQDVIVANIDQLVPVFACRHPDPHVRMLDRFLALAEIDELDSTVVANKIDLGVPEDFAAALTELERIGYPVLRTSAVTEAGIDELQHALRDRVSAVVGPSGVGKSSLLNAVEPELELSVAEVGQTIGKGRHTTRVRELHRLSGGGLVADTPGLREIGIWEVDPGELEWAFVEFRPFLNRCRFYDCTHVHEPGCEVRRAVERGDVSARRYDSYVRLLQDEEFGV